MAGHPIIFKDRAEAGKKLAERLALYELERPIAVVGLPRGGVPVGFEVAQALKAPLDTVVVRKIAAPDNKEFALGAVAPGDVLIINNERVESLNVGKEDLESSISIEIAEMERRMIRYSSGEYINDAPVRTLIIVDDGMATGITAHAAIESIKLIQKPKSIIFAVPVCSRDIAISVEQMVDDYICLRKAEDLISVSHWYENFGPVTDEEVVTYLQEANAGSVNSATA